MLTLTTARGGDATKLRDHFEALRGKIERRFHCYGLKHASVSTTEGNGVLHIILAWKGDRQFRLPAKWLSKEWEKLHGATRIDVRPMSTNDKSIRNVAVYFASQKGLLRYSSSRVVLGVAKIAKRFKSIWHLWNEKRLRKTELFPAWEMFLRFGGWVWSGVLYSLDDNGAVIRVT